MHRQKNRGRSRYKCNGAIFSFVFVSLATILIASVTSRFLHRSRVVDETEIASGSMRRNISDIDLYIENWIT